MLELQFCEIDENYTEHDYCHACDENTCQLCHNAYGCPNKLWLRA